MLSKSILWQKRVTSICERSGDILPGARFNGARLADSWDYDFIPAGETVICCGKIRTDELLFRTEDGRYYFSLCDGWGEEEGVLYGLRRGIFHDFKHPTTSDTILAECDAAVAGKYNSWSGAMLHNSIKTTIDVIRSVIEKQQE